MQNNKAKFKMYLNVLNIAYEGQLWHKGKLLKRGSPFALWKKLNIKDIDPEKEWKRLEKEKVKLLCVKEKEYPRLLKQIPYSPPLIYVKGDLPKNENFNFAIVGTRTPTAYGKSIAYKIASELAELGVNIISGLALGIDGMAHKAALDKKRPTFAVLGGGVDEKTLYPRAHLPLAREIIKYGGGIISEFPLGQRSFPQHFPQRNRIISGLSKGILVVEAKEKSGALITSDWALNQNRQVFAVPGPINSLASAGPNWLIKQGAKPVTCIEDILEELRWETAPQRKEISLTKEQKMVVDLLKNGNYHIDKIIESVNLKPQKVLSVISELELSGKVKNVGSEIYTLI